jgi:translocation and assembly module TamB
MTNNNSPNPQSDESNSGSGLLNKLKSSPKTVAGVIIAIAGFGALGYWGTQVLVKNRLPRFLENQIGNFIQRPIDLGEVKGFSLNGIEFGKTVIPATSTDPDKVIVEGVKVGFNLIPVLFRRTLPIDMSLIQPDIYLEQEQDGEWINLDFLQREKKELPISFDVGIDVEKADITAVPLEKPTIKATVDGNGRFNQAEERIAYDLDAGVQKAKATIKGETLLKTGKTDTKLLVKDLALSDVATLLPNSPVNLSSGQLNADLDLDIPSFDQITTANVQGMVRLENLAGEVTDLDAPIKAESRLDLNGRNANFKVTQANLGNIVARLDGKVNLDKGYNLDVNVLPFSLSSLPNKIVTQLPVNVAGEVAAKLQLRGAIKEPILRGKINNTQTITVDKTQFKNIEADFTADLAEVILENVQITPVAGGKMIAAGAIETNIKQALEKNQAIDTTKMPLAFGFKANLPTEKLVAPYYQLPTQVSVGQLKASGQVNGTVGNPEALVEWQIAKANTGGAENIAGLGRISLANNNLLVRDTEITYGDGKVDVAGEANLDNKNWQANLAANSLYLTPFLTQFKNQNPNLNLDRPIALNTAKVKLNGKLNNLNLDQIQGVANLNLDTDGGDIAVNSQLNAGNLQAKATTNEIEIDKFVTNLPVAAILRSGEINASGKLKQLLAFKDNPNLNSVKADADLNLSVDGEAVAVNSQLNSGIVQANATTNRIDLNRLVANLPVPASVRSSNLNASGRLEQFLALKDNPDLSSVNAKIDADLNVAEGTVKAIANLNNNQWQTKINAANISSALLLKKFAPNNLASVNIEDINAQVDLTGNIQPLINKNINIPINVNRFAAQSGEQNFNAQGNLTLSDVTTNLDVANTNLNVNANIDFDRLPIDQLIATANQDNGLTAKQVNIAGKAEFKGQFQGKELISAPNNPGNVVLNGDVRLLDFAFNDIKFEPVMTGTVNVQPQQEIALNLRGQQDVIAASAVPCKGSSNCRLPYLPNYLELRQGEDTSQPVIATGDRNNNIFSLDIDNFPLALLNLAPGKAAGIDGALAGKTTGEVDFNLATFAAQGDVAIQKPALGYIQADKIAANFDYNPATNIAELTTASLDLGKSQYNLNAALNLGSGAIDGKLNIPEAYIQDLLTTLRWFTVEDALTLFNIPDYANAAAVRPAPERETVDDSIAEKLNLLRRINRKIQANAAAKEMGGIPTELGLKGRYFGEIALGGTIQTPEAKFRVEGNNWQWQTQVPYPDIVEPKGLVIARKRPINIPQLLMAGGLQGTDVNLEIAKLQVQKAVLSLSGKLSPQQEDVNFKVENLTVDNISNFVNVPVDIAGKINAEGNLTGSPSQPEIAGEVTFADGRYNGNILPAKIAGDFDYNGNKLAFNTTAPDSIQVEATVPYPIIPGTSDRVLVDANLKKEAFIFLNAFSQGYLDWIGGEGDAQLQADARLDLARPGILYDLDAKGIVNLKDAKVAVKTPFFTEPFQGTGKITLNNQIVNVENLDATFAEKDLSVAGRLPILSAVNNLENPLTVNIPEGDIDINKLYKGGVQGKAVVTGAALKPVIGGQVNLEDGTVSIPKTETPTAEEQVQKVKEKVSSATSGKSKSSTKTPTTTIRKANNANKPPSTFITTLSNFKINLKDFKLEQNPVYEFQLDGGLVLNGTVDQPANIKPKGTLVLTQADVDLLSSNFNLARDRENTIVFTPQAGIFNPALDIGLKTEVSEVDDVRLAESGANEIPDPLSQSGNSDLITVFLTISGETAEIIPNLGQRDVNCNIRPNDSPLLKSKQSYNRKELNRLSECLNTATLDDGDNNQIINSPAAELTSIPSRSQGEIISLFGNKFLAFAEQIQNSSQSELFDLGVNQFVIAPIQRNLLYKVDDTVVGIGKKVGLDYLRVLPNFEGIYEINRDSSVRSTYNYVLNEVKFEYETRF